MAMHFEVPPDALDSITNCLNNAIAEETAISVSIKANFDGSGKQDTKFDDDEIVKFSGALAASKKLQSLSLRAKVDRHYIDESKSKELVLASLEAFRANQSFKALNINLTTEWSVDVAKTVGAMCVESKSLQSLIMRVGMCPREGEKKVKHALQAALCSSSLRSLELSGFGLSDDTYSGLSDGLQSSCWLTSLSVSDFHQLPDCFGLSVAQSLKANSVLRSLSLMCSGFSDKVFIALADMIRINATLEALTLKKWKVKDKTGIPLAHGLLANDSLKSVILSFDEELFFLDQYSPCIHSFNVEMAEALKRKSSLHTFEMPLISRDDDHAARVIADMLRVNRSIKQLGLSCLHLSNDGDEALATVLQHNTSLQSLTLSRRIGRCSFSIRQTMASIADMASIRSLRLQMWCTEGLAQDENLAIATLLKKSTSLRSFAFEGQAGDTVYAVARAVIENRGLECLEICTGKGTKDIVDHQSCLSLVKAAAVHPSLRHLVLSKVQRCSLDAVVAGLELNQTLLHFRVSLLAPDDDNQGLDNSANAVISLLMKNIRILTLELPDSYLNSSGMDEIGAAVGTHNTTLRTFNLVRGCLGSTHAIWESCRRNRELFTQSLAISMLSRWCKQRNMSALDPVHYHIIRFLAPVEVADICQVSMDRYLGEDCDL